LHNIHHHSTLTFHPFSFHGSAHHRVLHSFPTRRSSDLGERKAHLGGTVELALFVEKQVRAEKFAEVAREPRHREIDRVREVVELDRKSTRLNSSHSQISYAVFCLKKKKDHASVRAQKR